MWRQCTCFTGTLGSTVGVKQLYCTCVDSKRIVVSVECPAIKLCSKWCITFGGLCEYMPNILQLSVYDKH